SAEGDGAKVPEADGSPASGPLITDMTAAMSSAFLAKTPTLSSDCANIITPVRGTNPNVGRRPVTPQKAAGPMTDPPVSVPKAYGTKPSATMMPDPADDPPE